jgi:hypothetical protein
MHGNPVLCERLQLVVYGFTGEKREWVRGAALKVLDNLEYQWAAQRKRAQLLKAKPVRGFYSGVQRRVDFVLWVRSETDSDIANPISRSGVVINANE